MLETWAPAIVFLAIALAMPVGMIAAFAIMGVRGKRNTVALNDTYECGEEPIGSAWIRFHPRYYIVALVFVAFDVEAAFLFPWALNIRDAGLFAIVDMVVFLTILLIGWAYAVRKGAIKWQ